MAITMQNLYNDCKPNYYLFYPPLRHDKRKVIFCIKQDWLVCFINQLNRWGSDWFCRATAVLCTALLRLLSKVRHCLSLVLRGSTHLSDDPPRLFMAAPLLSVVASRDAKRRLPPLFDVTSHRMDRESVFFNFKECLGRLELQLHLRIG